jgi:hypothetical protein
MLTGPLRLSLSLQVYGCPIGGSLVQEQWAVDGSGSTYIWAALDDGFKWVTGATTGLLRLAGRCICTVTCSQQ